MTGSFLFVKPSNPEGIPGHAYDDETKPCYAYDLASWEWLLERAIRRSLLPSMLSISHSQVIAYGHEDQYSFARSAGYTAGDTVEPLFSERYLLKNTNYQDHNSIFAYATSRTDGALAKVGYETPLPIRWEGGRQNRPKYEDSVVAFGIQPLVNLITRLPFRHEWLPVDWSRTVLDKWDLTASTTESTIGECPRGGNWTWRTTVNHVPYALPDELPFQCLGHMRTDDEIITTTITNDDGDSVEVESGSTLLNHRPREEYNGLLSTTDYAGYVVRRKGSGSLLGGAARLAGVMHEAFSLPYFPNADYSESEDTVAYGRNGKTSERISNPVSTIGCLIGAAPGPDIQSKAVMISTTTYSNDSRYDHARFVPDVNWNNKPTYWHLKGFPKGLDSILSPTLREQLKALCPVCQPATPPHIPALKESYLTPPKVDWPNWAHINYYGAGIVYDTNERVGHDEAPVWLSQLGLAATPIDLSARLNEMTTTMHRVPHVFAKFSRTIERHQGSRYEYKSINGTTTSIIPNGNELSYNGTLNFSCTDYQGKVTSRATTLNCDYLICLRDISNTSITAQTTTTYQPNQWSEPETTVDGSLPTSYDPATDDLMFPPWIFPWLESVELFCAIESLLLYDRSDVDGGTLEENSVSTSTGTVYYGSGEGSVTHKAHRKIVSLGSMDLLTGKFPALDIVSLLNDIDPDPTTPSDRCGFETYSYLVDGPISTTTSKYLPSGTRVRNADFYVKVKWKFDKGTLETLATEAPFVALYNALKDAQINWYAKDMALTNIKRALSETNSMLNTADYRLTRAREQNNEADILKYTQITENLSARKASLEQAKITATEEKDAAQQLIDAAKQAIRDAGGSVS